MGGLLFSRNVGKMWANVTQGVDGTVETLVAEAFRRWVRVPLEALLETARDGGFPLFSNGFGIIAIHCDSTLFHGGLWKCGQCVGKCGISFPKHSVGTLSDITNRMTPTETDDA